MTETLKQSIGKYLKYSKYLVGNISSTFQMKEYLSFKSVVGGF